MSFFSWAPPTLKISRWKNLVSSLVECVEIFLGNFSRPLLLQLKDEIGDFFQQNFAAFFARASENLAWISLSGVTVVTFAKSKCILRVIPCNMSFFQVLEGTIRGAQPSTRLSEKIASQRVLRGLCGGSSRVVQGLRGALRGSVGVRRISEGSDPTLVTLKKLLESFF